MLVKIFEATNPARQEAHSEAKKKRELILMLIL